MPSVDGSWLAGISAAFPDGSPFRQSIKSQICEPHLPPELGPANIGPVDRDMNGLCSSSARGGCPATEELRSGTPPMEAREKIHMKVRRVEQGDGGRGACRTVDHERPSLVMCPSRSVGLCRHGISFTERRPPSLFQSLFPRRCIGRANGKPGYAFAVFDDKSQLRFKQSIWSGIDESHQLGIRVEM